MSDPGPGKPATPYLIVLALGFFAFVAQALLFREFLGVYEGSELGIACFFSSWLLWVALGAALARWLAGALAGVTRRFEFLPLLYVPAYIVQFLLIRSSRDLAGVESYELFPLAKMLPVSFVANAPVCFLTGALFVLACRWLTRQDRATVARVYICEAVGGSVGGIATTIALALGAPSEAVFLYAVVGLTAAILAYKLPRRAYVGGWLPFGLALLALASGADRRWARSNRLHAWRRLLPASGYLGAVRTPSGRYLYGTRRQQFNVIAWGSVVESVPNNEHASEVVALHLAQYPEARRFLVIGAGSFAVCQRLAALPGTAKVTWLTPDPDYPAQLLRILPVGLRRGADKIELPGRDVRDFLRTADAAYDVIMLNLPDPTTLALNRYFTSEFLQLLKQRLAAGGVVGIRLSGGDNFMGGELARLGASAYYTAAQNFLRLALKPGDESWLLASDGERLSQAPATLRERLKTVAGVEGLYPPDGLMSLYLPDRIDYQLGQYQRLHEEYGKEGLANTEAHPKGLLFTLLFTARQAGAPPAVAAFVEVLAANGLAILLAAIGLYALLRFLFVLAQRRSAPPTTGDEPASTFDAHFLVFSTGAAGMAMSLLLMFVYQARFGSIFLHVGLIAAVFMLGLTLGGALTDRLLSARGDRGQRLLGFGVLAHLVMLLVVPALPDGLARWHFVLLFLAAGGIGGIYVPLAAARLKAAGCSDHHAGWLVELFDHVGGAIGGLLTGVILLPVFGVASAVGVLATLLAANLLALAPRVWLARLLGKPARPLPTADADGFDRALRPLGYGLFGVGAFLVVASGLYYLAPDDATEARLQAAFKAMRDGGELVRQSANGPDGAGISYYERRNDVGETTDYLFGTDRLGADVTGYAGPIVMALRVDAAGRLGALEIVQSNETPSYLRALGEWQRTLVGRELFRPNALAGIDAVSGATVSSKAILATIEQASAAFAGSVLKLPVGPAAAPARPWLPDRQALALILLAGAALILRWRPATRLWRRAFLLVVVVVLGFWLNLQYSSSHVFSLAGLRLPAPGFGAGFLMIVGVPLLVVLCGNVYCGYLCPFGALQELIGDLRPSRWRSVPGKETWRYGRLLKYLILLVFVVIFAAGHELESFAADPLSTVFSQDRGRWLALFVGAILALSFFFPRLWCRNLCPAGALLSLLNGLRWLRRLIPGISAGRCVYGVRQKGELDCICCDRCRVRAPADAAAEAGAMGWGARAAFLGVVLVLGALLCGAAFSARRTAVVERRATAVRRGAASGARQVDMGKVRRMLDQGELSDHEAMFYRQQEAE